MEGEDDIEFALSLAIDKLKEHYPNYETDPDIDLIIDIYNNYFG